MTPGDRDLDSLANDWVETRTRLNPVLGTRIGLPGPDLPDYSPEGHEEVIEAARQLHRMLALSPPQTFDQEVTARELRRESEQLIAEHDADMLIGKLNVIDSPAQEIRNSFDLMPRHDEQDWEAIARRLGEVPKALAGYRVSLGERARSGPPVALRQVHAVARQAEQVAAGLFRRQFGDAPVSDALGAELRVRATEAERSYAELATFLQDELAGAATDEDAVGRERYAIASRGFLGTGIDFEECHDWALELLADLTDRQRSLARAITGGDSLHEAFERLNRDPDYLLQGVDALQAWLQEVSDEAIESLADAYFEIPAGLRRLECRIAPSQDGGIYYTEPSLDGQRAGRMWWSVPAGITEFHTWRERTTVYHEGVPGHHLQMGGAALAESSLNVWRRSVAGTSGHREGWALYAEQLMHELGYLDDAGSQLGMLDAARMRAARVVLDIGLHLGLPRPDGMGAWTAEYAFAFMRQHTVMNEKSLRYEVLRYLGWPGQAACYSLGQREWELARSAAEHRAKATGQPFRLRDFHTRTLALGGIGLDTLRWATSHSPAGVPE